MTPRIQDTRKLSGLIAATYTPMDRAGGLQLNHIPSMVQWLVAQGVSGLYVCGSTGEGMSLSTGERMEVAEAFVQGADGRIPVLVQVGHNSLGEAKTLAAHAVRVGADIISATCPSYYKISTVSQLVDCMAEIALAAAGSPFYYYHIPALSGAKIDMAEFLRQGEKRIPNLAGIKFTESSLHEFQECVELHDGKFDIVWGVDEMLLAAVATGAQAAIGSTYNVYASVYQQVLKAVREGDLNRARQYQSSANRMIRTLYRYPFHPAMKALIGMLGHPVGPCRLPQPQLSAAEIDLLQKDAEEIGFFELAGQHAETGK